MILLSPWLLLALLVLPALWWLLRVTPPAPRRQEFPAARLLLALPSRDETPARTPLWLLALRMTAAALLVIGLAGPIFGGSGPTVTAPGPVTLVLDDGWAAAADWSLRVQAADQVAAEAERSHRAMLLLLTAPQPDGASPALQGPMTATVLRAKLPTLRPLPWPSDRAASARALQSAPVQPGSFAYIADGLTDGPGWTEFAAALAAGPTVVVQAATAPGQVLKAAPSADGWGLRLTQTARPVSTALRVRAEASDGRVLGSTGVAVSAGARLGTASIMLPTELRNRVDRLTLEAPDGSATPSAAAVVLLDEADRRRPVGMLTTGPESADTPLTGAAYFPRRAISPFAEWREGPLDALLARPLAVLIAADRPLLPGPDSERLRDWIEHGGTLIRFAGPDIAQAAQDGQPDPLLPVALLPADRQMGGSMSWSKPASLAPFPTNSPFAGLAATADMGGGAGEIVVSRQVLADPAADLSGSTWARLTDGTPLVTQRAIGAGRVVLFHVTANAEWSNLPLSGLFVDMLRRLLALSAGVGADPSEGGALAPTRMLDGFGGWTSPPSGARPIAAADWATTVASPAHPPGLYGPQESRRVLNLSQGLADPTAAPPLGARHLGLASGQAARPLGPLLVALAALLLLLDLMLSLRARGLLRAGAATAAVVLLCSAVTGLRAEPYDAALATRLAYVRTGDPTVDDVARAGLAGLSAYVNERTAAQLADPVAVVPGHDDLTFFPLLYWPISPEAPLPDPVMLAALNGFMASGGVILIDTRDGGSGTGMAAGARDLLLRLAGGTAGGGLAAPPLAPLTGTHVLARSFYLLSEFPGRYAGDTVWIARDTDRSNDSVSPLVIGGHDWAAAWATDADGQHPFATLPGGDRQRTLAYRFGVNLVMYSLTGNYKGDQVHVPALLQRLGQ